MRYTFRAWLFLVGTLFVSTARAQERAPAYEHALGDVPMPNAPSSVHPRAFNMVVLGDSYMWMPGLLREETAYWLVWKHIADLLAGYREVTPPRVFARSGAIIGRLPSAVDGCPIQPNASKDAAAPWPGDVPTAFWEDQHPNGDQQYTAPSIWEQLRRARLATRPEGVAAPGYVSPNDVDLVLVNGGGNDIGVFKIVTPFEPENNHATIRNLTAQCLADRLHKLLFIAVDDFPRAQIVVTGYPQIVTGSSSALEVGKYLIALATATGAVLAATGNPTTAATIGTGVGGVGFVAGSLGLREGARQESQVFAEESNAALRRIVLDVNVRRQSTRLHFADVQQFWGDLNGYAAPESYLWRFTAPANPPDHTSNERWEICKTHNRVFNSTTDFECAHGAAAHPNPAGAKAYARAIIQALDVSGVGWLGLKVMQACVDAVVDNAQPAASQSGPAYPTFQITVHAQDLGDNRPIAALGSLGAAAPFPTEKMARFQLCQPVTSQLLKSMPGAVSLPPNCIPKLGVSAVGYAPVEIETSSIFGGRIPGVGAATAAPGVGFHY